MIEYEDIVKSRSWVFMIVLGAIALFAGAVKVEQLTEFKFAPRSPPGATALVIGTVLMVGSITLHTITRRLAGMYAVHGPWTYEVTTTSKNFSHSGTCNISQDGHRLHIAGTRTRICVSPPSGPKTCKTVSIPWSTSWASICDDHCLRFDYHIAHPSGPIQGHCQLSLDRRVPFLMNGKYHILPPYPSDVPNATHGIIVMKRIRKAKLRRTRPRTYGAAAVAPRGVVANVQPQGK